MNFTKDTIESSHDIYSPSGYVPSFYTTSTTPVDDLTWDSSIEVDESVVQLMTFYCANEPIQPLLTTTGIVNTRDLHDCTIAQLWTWLQLNDMLLLPNLAYTMRRGCPHCQGRFLSERIKPVDGLTTYCQDCRTCIKPIDLPYYYQLSTSHPLVALRRYRKRLLNQLQKRLINLL